jgi:type III secretion protein T
MDSAQLVETLKGYEVYIIAIAMAGARMGGAVLVLPAFTRLGLSGMLRTSIALTMAIPLLPLMVTIMAPQPLGFGQAAAILAKEVAVGMILGLLLGVPIWAAEAAGEILDLQRGVTFAELVDPSYTTQNNVMGTFFALVMVAIYFMSGGLSVTLRTIYDSYTLWPLTSFTPMFSREAGEVLLAVLDDIVGLGVMLVAPIILALLLADLSLALVARAAPHMNIFVLSLPVKNLALTVLMVLYGAFLLSYLKDNLRGLIDARPKLERIAPPQAQPVPPR